MNKLDFIIELGIEYIQNRNWNELSDGIDSYINGLGLNPKERDIVIEGLWDELS